MKHDSLYLKIAATLVLAASVPSLISARAEDPAQVLAQLEDRTVKMAADMANIQARADAEKRPLNADERKELEGILSEHEQVMNEITLRRKIADVQVTAQGVDPTQVAAAAAASSPAKPNTGAAPAQRGNSVVVDPVLRDPRNENRNGFNSFGQFAHAVRMAVVSHNTNMDPRLIRSAASTYSSEGIGQDGGFAVPPDFRAEIIRKVMGEESLLARTDQQTSNHSNSFTVPLDETTPWQSSGGIQTYWEGEAGQITQSKIALDQLTTKLNKLTALVPVTEELLEDAGAVGNYLRSKAPEKMDFKIQDAILNGNGVGIPLGILNSGATIEVAAESGQTADSVIFENIVNLWTRLYSPCRSRAVWLINGDVEQQLISMRFPGNNGTVAPVYLPPGGLSASPYGTLMGRPVLPIEACPALGDAGDIVLADLSKYLTVTKSGGIRQDVSIHLFFDQDITAFRFIFRLGGQPWWKNPIVRNQSAALSRSCFVKLGAR